jgi:hypothetical protein
VTERWEDQWERRIRDALDRVPGYRGYRLKEDRRDADRRVRNAVADAYAVELARVERVGRELANARRIEQIAAVERASQAIRHFIDRVRTVSPGYGGLLGERDVDGVALDQLRLFDESLLLGIDELRPALDQLDAAVAAGQPLAPAASAIERTIASQGERLDLRQEVVETGAAAGRDNVLTVLKGMPNLVPPAAYTAQLGDAISILGDDHLVNGRIDVDGRPQAFRLFRIRQDPEEWLLVGREPGSEMARVQPVDPPPAGTAIPGHAFRQRAAGTGDGEVSSEHGSSGLRAVRYALLEDPDDANAVGLVLHWDGERQAFAGQRVEPIDVEVFRRGGAPEEL